GLADLEDVANGEKLLPDEFINDNGTGITEAFAQYALPLIKGQAPLEVADDGLPRYARLDRTPVKKRTPVWSVTQ
ncbi:MAG: diphosphate--fructose-6-phosphate 1-phosphotransferase, partial [bacterium]|nr:diphosphate--fructose-6-phosphate 1-phosphotransferase [bacterium]